MKRKFLISLIAALSLATTTSPIVHADTSSEVYYKGFTSKNPRKYFKKWTSIVLTKNTKFTEVLDNLAPQSMWDKYQKGQLQGRTKTLKKGTTLKIKAGKYARWDIKISNLPAKKHYHWNMDNEKYFVQSDSNTGISIIFAKKRKVKLTETVEATKQRWGHPNAYTRIIGYKKLKKGTTLTVQSGGRYPYQVWGKSLPTSHKDDFWIIDKKGVWYKFVK